MSRLQLTPDERVWLDAYRSALRRHSDKVVRMLIYGSKARGDAHADSDLDVLLIVRNDAAHAKMPLRMIGYDLAATSNAVPSIMAYTAVEWQERRALGNPFQRAVERDGVSVLATKADDG